MAWFYIIIGLLFVGVAAYYWLTGYTKDSNDPEQRKSEVSAKYSTDMGRFAARKEKKAAEARSQLLEATNQEQRLIDANEEREAASKVSYAGKEIELERLAAERTEIRVRTQLIRLAHERGMDIVTYLKVTEHAELKTIDLQARELEYKQDQEQISRVQQERLELVDRATHRLFSMYDQRKKLEGSRDKAKEDKLAQLNYNIQIAEELIRGEQARYLEATLGQEGQRSLPATDGTGRAESEAGESEEPKRGRGRPRGSRNRPADEQGT